MKIVFDVHLQIALQLFRQLAVTLFLAEQRGEAQTPGAQTSRKKTFRQDDKETSEDRWWPVPIPALLS